MVDPTPNDFAAAVVRLAQARLHIPVHPSGVSLGTPGQVHQTPKLFWQVHGSTRFELPHTRFILRPSQWCLMPPYHAHREIPRRGRDGYATMILILRHQPASLLQVGITPAGGLQGHTWHRVDGGWREAVIRHCEECISAERQARGDADYRQLLQAGMGHGCAALARSVIPERGRPPALVAQCLTHIESHLHDPELRLATVATSMDISAEHLARLFRAETDRSVGEYIRIVRLERSAQLLQETGAPIAAIATSVGFTSGGYFTRRFREHYGCTPREFRQRAGNRATG